MGVGEKGQNNMRNYASVNTANILSINKNNRP